MTDFDAQTITDIAIGVETWERGRHLPNYIEPKAYKLYHNRVYDTTAGSFVIWTSVDSPDSTGTSYPGPGTFGVNTSDYCLVNIQVAI